MKFILPHGIYLFLGQVRFKVIKIVPWLGMMINAYNPSYSGGRIMEDWNWRSDQEKC
jgi:hypothetical protein